MTTRARSCSQLLLSGRPVPPTSICPQCRHHNILYTTASSTQLRKYHPSRRRNVSPIGAAVSAAQNLFTKGFPKAPPGVSVDPLRIVGKELKFLSNNIRNLLGSGHPMLDKVAKYYTWSEGKHVRPLLVLLMSQATAPTRDTSRSPPSTQSYISQPISSPLVLADANPDTSPLTAPAADLEGVFGEDPNILPAQRRLAEITELIHTASLLHDDVIDNAVTRRSSSSANMQFGNKMAVLAGDFLLGRASVALARLRNPEVIELLATVIANLVEGEFMQLKNTAANETYPVFTDDTISYYLQKTYLKTASLISKSCRAAALLGEHTPETVEAAYLYGRNLGLAFQLVDDMLDYTVTSTEFGKPAGADLELGLATAPLLFAWKRNPELGALVGRKFGQDGDVERARHLVSQSDGVEQTRLLAQEYADKAVEAIQIFPDSEAKNGLIEMCKKTMNRRK
ncbi:putative hexaprenyl pyrophosphate synthetase Coq1 [Talaromyces proteolyticus]|uniref:Hexaprenyl pyrophosphate synthetase Coq1 n=1 Tax=Talaromyces proteolyticus TaxID=1131652 RepID=A0AAD4Q5E1_9EURO|nr:putative hexaprenyl pyrophosphate synthetase Coq1 [Talaromyces proteolyticus]KAH8703925.1 putative hexaprenyl pyrophosphate synthetase Coq1 [Talaromyces proteolyticus]